MRVRSLDDMRAGEAVYAVGAQGGPRMLTKSTRVTGFSGSGETRAARIPAGLPASFAGGGLFDRSGALIGVVVLHARGGDGSTLVMPVPGESQSAESAPGPAKATATTEVPPEGGAAPRVAPIAAAKPPAQPSGENRNLAYRDAMSKYLGDVVRAAVSRATYPPEARKAQWTGTSSIRFRLGPGGLLVESGVERSSGYDTLDVAALLAVRSAIAELPLPPSVEEWGMTGSVLITFQLPEK
jgi:TonB family protein